MTDASAKRTTLCVLIFSLGAGTLLAHLYHLFEEAKFTQILSGVLPPAVASVGLSVAAVYLYRSDLEDRYFARAFGWTVGGAVGLAVLGSGLMVYQMSHGAVLEDLAYMVSNWAATGGLGGVFVGYYDAHRMQVQATLQRERNVLAEREADLERQNDRLERLAHIVSHDLRNPLNVAMGRVAIARDTGDLSHLDDAENALHRMEGIIQDTLAMARDGQQVVESDLATVSLTAVAEASWNAVDTAGATLEVVGESRFAADESRLRNVFENLFRNAVEHAGPDVSVRVGTLPDGTGFYVEDDGPGVPDGPDVFDAGYSTAAGGTGLGLSIVRETVEAHGWDVELTTGSSGGARFEITGPG